MTKDLLTVEQQLERSGELSSLEEFAKADDTTGVRRSAPVLLLDCSGSMSLTMRNGRRRIDGLRDVVREVTSANAMRMIAFSTESYFVERDSVPSPGGSTAMHRAIDMATAKEFGHLIVVSDGQPNSRTDAMAAARRFGGRIDVVFVGNPDGYGESFLRELAESTGGTEFHGDLSEVKELTRGILGLITA